MMRNTPLLGSFPWISHEHANNYCLCVKHDAGEMQLVFQRSSCVHRNQDERRREASRGETLLISTMHFLMHVFLIHVSILTLPT